MPKKVFFYMSGNLHNAYKQMLANPPEGIEYTQSEGMAFKNSAFEKASLHLRLIKRIAPGISPFYNKLGVYLDSPKCRKLSVEGYDLVHSCQSILDSNIPYVVDFEHAAVFSGFNQFAFSREAFKKALRHKLLDNNLRKIIAWSNAARSSLLNPLKDEELEKKTETVYAVVSPPEKVERVHHAGANLLFVGKVFFEKGGYDALLAFDRISDKYDCKLTIVSKVPEEVRSQFSKNKKIFFLENVSPETLKQLYLETDLLVFPTHYDTFGYVVAEAFSYGIPVLSVDNFSIPELVDDGKNGIIVKCPFSSFNGDFSYKWGTAEELAKKRLHLSKNPSQEYINLLSEKMALLIEDSSLRSHLSKNARKEATEGKFSPRVWKEKMGKIYAESLKD